MTTFRKTLNRYEKGNKAMAFLIFKSDENAQNKSFEEFCKGMDKIIALNNSKAINPNKN